VTAALDRLLRTDPAARRCYHYVTGQLANPTLDDVGACYGTLPGSPSIEEAVDCAVRDGRVEHQKREIWVRRLAEQPRLGLEILADLPPRRDLAEQAWWAAEGDRLYVELQSAMGEPEPDPWSLADEDPEFRAYAEQLDERLRPRRGA
jgi:hypothetical protein